jgi:hypothetical protein
MAMRELAMIGELDQQALSHKILIRQFPISGFNDPAMGGSRRRHPSACRSSPHYSAKNGTGSVGCGRRGGFESTHCAKSSVEAVVL